MVAIFSSVPAYLEYTTLSPLCEQPHARVQPACRAAQTGCRQRQNTHAAGAAAGNCATVMCNGRSECGKAGKCAAVAGLPRRRRGPRRRTLTALALPTDVISPCVGFVCALLGSRMPLLVFSSLTSTLTSTRSPTGATVLYCRAARRPARQGDRQRRRCCTLACTWPESGGQSPNVALGGSSSAYRS